MKTTLLTIAITFMVLVGMAQTKEKYIPNNAHSFWDEMNRQDTIRCWFKEVVINFGNMDTLVTNGYANLNNAVSEYWQHGYVIRKHNSTAVLMLDHWVEDLIFLYADRKTKVTNHVIYYVQN